MLFNVRLLIHPLTHSVGHIEHDPNGLMVGGPVEPLQKRRLR